MPDTASAGIPPAGVGSHSVLSLLEHRSRPARRIPCSQPPSKLSRPTAHCDAGTSSQDAGPADPLDLSVGLLDHSRKRRVGEVGQHSFPLFIAPWWGYLGPGFHFSRRVP
jgi:hypothetical protein